MFGSSKKHDNETRNETRATDIDNVFGTTDDRNRAQQPTDDRQRAQQPTDDRYRAQQPTDDRHRTQPTGAGTGNVNTLGQTQGGTGGHGTNYNNDKALGEDPAFSQPFSQNQNDQYPTGRSDESRGIPPSGSIDHDRTDQTNRQGAGGRLGGKIESTIGSAVGSEALKAQGLRKENEAKSFKLQSGELAEAERLEREALTLRQRAVEHGASPANSSLGAGNPAVGSTQRQL